MRMHSSLRDTSLEKDWIPVNANSGSWEGYGDRKSSGSRDENKQPVGKAEIRINRSSNKGTQVIHPIYSMSDPFSLMLNVIVKE